MKTSPEKPATSHDFRQRDYKHLVEKNKELSCLYGITQIIHDTELSFDDKLRDIAHCLGPAFRYPERLQVRIRLDRFAHQTPDFHLSRPRLSEKVVVQGKERGCVEVGYMSADPPDKGRAPAFIAKEKKMLKTVARQLVFKLEKKGLKDQLLHADRLATIGQLAAGIAHELNNPLTDILGFAQLASNRPDLPEETYQDLERIVKSALYAREVIKKILLFSRQSLPRESKADLNAIIREWLDFIESRCVKNGVDVIAELHPELEPFSADPGQLSQILINLVINAIDAMPDGGRLTLHTGIKAGAILLKVGDTGSGIPEADLDKIFLPFFTTKDVDQGTGLGLSVVYGIVKEHGGTIAVKSTPGKGTVFEIVFPV